MTACCMAVLGTQTGVPRLAVLRTNGQGRRSDCGSRGECFVLLLSRIFTGSYRGAVLVSAM